MDPTLRVVEGYHNQIRDDIVGSVPRSTGTLVDVGGGTGATAVHLKSLGLASRVGVIDQLSSDQAHPDLDFHCSGEIEDGAFLDDVVRREGPFDTILVLDILEHLVDPWRTVRELHQALAPGGRMIASIPNVRHYRVSGGLFFRNRWQLADAGILDRTHLRFFVRDTAIELMTHSGLVLEAVESPDHDRHRRERALFNRLTFGKLQSFIDVRYLVRVRRDDPVTDIP